MEEKSIVNIIIEMVQKGETEEKIIATLKELGLSEEQIKGLMMVAKANVFAVLKGEIVKMTKETIDKVLPEYEKKVAKELKEYNEAKMKEMEEKIRAEINKRIDEFEQKQLKELKNMADIVDSTQQILEEQKKDIMGLDAKIEEKALGSTKTLRILRIIGFVVGLGMFIATMIKFFSLGIGTSIDFIILYILNVIAATVIMVLSLI